MSQTATLFRARRTAWSNARRSNRGAFRPAVVTGLVVATCAIMGIGELSVDSLLGAPVDTATPVMGKRPPIRGDAALEAAFWLSVMMCAFFAFRVMESLFRSAEVRALELLPVEPGPVFAERTANAALEATGLAAALSMFFLPLAWHGEPLLAGMCAMIALGATLCTAAVTIGTNAWFGAQFGGASGLGDGYGGQGGAFIYAPMASFGLAVVCVMMLQLGAREMLHAAKITNAFWLALGIAFGIALWTLAVGGRQFVASYHRVAAFFREADEVGFRAVLDYQTSAWLPARFEAFAGEGRFVFRRHVLQFARRFPVARSLVFLGSAAAAIAAATLSVEACPNWVVGVAPAALFALLERPFTRIFDERLGGHGDDLLPLAPATVRRATVVWWFYEVGRIALPYALIAGIARAVTSTPIDGLLVATIGCSAPIALAALIGGALQWSELGIGSVHVLALLTLILFGGVAAISLPAAAAITAVVAVVGAAIHLSGSRA